ncbi:hypothetical protein [uncultured Aquimarina sp.]|uniref:hypothetical protein n=1 Tax=uncultured Aquimarina sp. TaxID=575652 RepID=UPI002627820C|nr:hypothetical protein [uncultured Aquimarina sp.]
MNRSVKQIAEKIIGRHLFLEEGMKQSSIFEQEKRLNIKIPATLKELYLTLGNNALFTDGFHHFAEVAALFVKDNKLVFLQENQSVVYWAVDLTDSKTVYQTSDQNFDETVEWYSEELSLDQFIEMILYVQCVMSDESFHAKAKSGFQYFASLDISEYHSNEKSKNFIDTLENDYKEIIRGNGLRIYWDPETILMYFLNKENQISDMILTCTKDEAVLDKMIDAYGFNQL